MAHKKKLIITVMSSDRIVVDVAELLIPSSVNLNNLVIETKIVNDTPPRLKRDRSPLSTDALTLADIKIGQHIRVVHAGHCSDLLSQTGHPRRSDNDDNIIVPVAIIMPEGVCITPPSMLPAWVSFGARTAGVSSDTLSVLPDPN